MGIQKLTCKAETRLERHVKRWANERASDYPDSGVEGVLEDLFYGGCSSGMVGHLIYTTDCVKFFATHRRDISALLAEMVQDTGQQPHELFSNPRSLQWDKDDPLAQEDNNRNLLAWFGFEEAARRLSDRQGLDL
jgi:hypothetical protein